MEALLCMIVGVSLLLYGASTQDYGTSILGSAILGAGIALSITYYE